MKICWYGFAGTDLRVGTCGKGFAARDLRQKIRGKGFAITSLPAGISFWAAQGFSPAIQALEKAALAAEVRDGFDHTHN